VELVGGLVRGEERYSCCRGREKRRVDCAAEQCEGERGRGLFLCDDRVNTWAHNFVDF
jgi:hypothetical protein